MRRMYSESQLLRLIKENSSSTKDYNHRITLSTNDGTYVIDFRLTDSKSDAYDANTFGRKYFRTQFAARIYNADDKTYHCGFVMFNPAAWMYVTLDGASAAVEYLANTFTFEDSVTED